MKVLIRFGRPAAAGRGGVVERDWSRPRRRDSIMDVAIAPTNDAEPVQT
jgi:hypothetical protein